MTTRSRHLTMTLLAGLLGLTLACGGGEPAPAAPPPTADVGGHAHEAPHGGVLVELGDHVAFLEFVLDEDTGSLTVYVLDGAAEQAVRVSQETIGLVFEAPGILAGTSLELKARANVLTGETAGDSSQFVVTHESLKGVKAFKGQVLQVLIKGQTFRDVPVTLRPPA